MRFREIVTSKRVSDHTNEFCIPFLLVCMRIIYDHVAFQKVTIGDLMRVLINLDTKDKEWQSHWGLP